MELNQLRRVQVALVEVFSAQRQLLLGEYQLQQVDCLDRSPRNRVPQRVYLRPAEVCLVLPPPRPLQLHPQPRLLEEACSHSVNLLRPTPLPHLPNLPRQLRHRSLVLQPRPLRPPLLRPLLLRLLLLVDYSVVEGCLAQSQRKRRMKRPRPLLLYVSRSANRPY